MKKLMPANQDDRLGAKGNLESATCPLCEKEGASRLFYSRDRVHHLPGTFAVHCCVDCHAVFIQPWLSDAELASYYPQAYGRYRHARSLTKKSYRGWQRLVLEHYYGYPSKDGPTSRFFKKAPAFLLSFVTAKEVFPYRGTGKILDIGCGGGSFLYRLKQWGWDTYGVEPSKTGAEQARALGLTVFHGTLSESQFENAFFDVIRLSHVLEHLKEPTVVFREIDRILKPDGRIYLTVPNTRSLGFWLFQENWYALDSPRHVISYCPKTLQTLCDATGFEIAQVRYTAGPFTFVRSIDYFLQERGKDWPRWIKKIDWPRNKAMRRALKPFFFCVDAAGFGDFLHATLKKKPSLVQRFVLTWPAEAAIQGKLSNEQTV